MSDSNAVQSMNQMEEPSEQSKPSLRARILTRLIRLGIKRWPRNDYNAVVRRARRVSGLPVWLTFLISRGVSFEEQQDPDICGEWVVPEANYYEEKVLLYLHGGGYVSCNPQTHRPITAALARLSYRRVFALDYRVAPEATFPAAGDDAARAFP